MNSHIECVRIYQTDVGMRAKTPGTTLGLPLGQTTCGTALWGRGTNFQSDHQHRNSAL
jgi:hypothetical protein